MKFIDLISHWLAATHSEWHCLHPRKKEAVPLTRELPTVTFHTEWPTVTFHSSPSWSS
jgi:hypothetical protein